MSLTMLKAVLLMPPKLWGNGKIDILQRYNRYKEAAKLIDNLQDALNRIAGVEVYHEFPGADCNYEELARDVYPARLKYLQKIANDALVS